jgi:mRNA interferase MazF
VLGNPCERRTRPPGLFKATSEVRSIASLGGGGSLAPRLARGDVRLYQFAPPDKKRPVVVLTRDSAIAYLSTVTVAPITSTIRGVPSEVVLSEEDGMKSPCAVNLHNTVTISQNRLGRRVSQLNPLRMREICVALRFSLGCD